MNTQARRKKIEETLHAEGFCNVASLSKLLSVSEVTIRNDLSALEDEGKITRIHGGAIVAGERTRGENFGERTSINQERKRWIARRAADLVENYDSIILDASTTVFYMAQYLKDRRGLTVFTNGIEVAFQLAENRSNKVALTGGLLRIETSSLSGHFGNGMLGGIRASKAFLSCTGWSPTMELMDDDLFEAQLKKEMVDAAESVIFVVDSSKFEKQGVATFASASNATMILTDDQIRPFHLAALRSSGIRVSVCGEHTMHVVEGGNEEKRIRIGFANQNDANPFPSLVRQGLIQAAARANVELLLADNRADGPTALANVEYFVKEKVDLVIEFNTDVRYGNVIMERLRSTGVPVLAIDIPMPGATFVGVDNYKAGLIGGRLAGYFVTQVWNSSIDMVLSLELPLSGPIPAARMQGQIDGLRELLTIPEESVIHLDSRNTYEEAYKAVSKLLPALKSAQHVVLFGINDETVLGALAAFEAADSAQRVIAVGQGTDQRALQELQKPASRLIGSVAFFPEYYGTLAIDTALQILQGKQAPPAVYTNHVLVLSEETKRILDLSKLHCEKISALNYATHQPLHLEVLERANKEVS